MEGVEVEGRLFYVQYYYLWERYFLVLSGSEGGDYLDISSSSSSSGGGDYLDTSNSSSSSGGGDYLDTGSSSSGSSRLIPWS
jgi:hypothetical protein